MARGDGKGWAKGRTAKTDARIALAAAGHRGKRYTRRTPISADKWRKATNTLLPLIWSDTMAYVVGLTATDGCLLSARPAINFTSKDRQLVECYLRLLARTNAITTGLSGSGALVHRTTFKDAALYAWFEDQGLMPRKSHLLGPLAVPEEHLAPLVRGLLDGDGSISNGVWKADTTRRSDYYYESLRVRFCSASRKHVDWLHARLATTLGLRGWVTTDRRRESFYTLAYGKHDSIRLLTWVYADDLAPALERKRQIWLGYSQRHLLLGPAASAS